MCLPFASADLRTERLFNQKIHAITFSNPYQSPRLEAPRASMPLQAITGENHTFSCIPEL